MHLRVGRGAFAHAGAAPRPAPTCWCQERALHLGTLQALATPVIPLRFQEPSSRLCQTLASLLLLWPCRWTTSGPSCQVSCRPAGKHAVSAHITGRTGGGLGPYGQDLIHAPNIAKLASESTTFLRAYCQQAVCSYVSHLPARSRARARAFLSITWAPFRIVKAQPDVFPGKWASTCSPTATRQPAHGCFHSRSLNPSLSLPLSLSLFLSPASSSLASPPLPSFAPWVPCASTADEQPCAEWTVCYAAALASPLGVTVLAP